MLTLEVFLSCDCLSAPAARSIAKKAVKKVKQFQLIFRDEAIDQARAKSIGLFIFPAFVVDTDILTIGTPSLEQLVFLLREKVLASKKYVQNQQKGEKK